MARKSGSTGKLQLLSAGREPLREAKPLGRRQGEHPADLLQVLGLEPGFGVRLAVVGKRAEAAGGIFSALGHRPIVSRLVNDRLAAGPAAGLAGGRLGFQLRAEQRAAVDDPGSGEMAIPGAFLLDAAATWRLTDGLDHTLRGSNLTDETWFPSADELAVPAPGCGFGLSLAWTP